MKIWSERRVFALFFCKVLTWLSEIILSLNKSHSEEISEFGVKLDWEKYEVQVSSAFCNEGSASFML